MTEQKETTVEEMMQFALGDMCEGYGPESALSLIEEDGDDREVDEVKRIDENKVLMRCTDGSYWLLTIEKVDPPGGKY